MAIVLKSLRAQAENSQLDARACTTGSQLALQPPEFALQPPDFALQPPEFALQSPEFELRCIESRQLRPEVQAAALLESVLQAKSWALGACWWLGPG